MADETVTRAARLLIQRYGDNAHEQAERQVATYATSGRADLALEWAAVADAILGLTAPAQGQPAPGAVVSRSHS